MRHVAPTDLAETLRQRLNSNPSGVVETDVLILTLPTISLLDAWLPLLVKFNPRKFYLCTRERHLLPSVHYLSQAAVDDLVASWTQLVASSAEGAGSVLLVPSEEGQACRLVVGECMRRKTGPYAVSITLEERRKASDRESSLAVAEEDLLDFLEDEDPLALPLGTYSLRIHRKGSRQRVI